MHYQISLSINPTKKLLLETQELRQDHKSASPTRTKNNSYKTLSRTNSISKGKITEILHNNWMAPTKKISHRKESPVIPHVQLLLTQKIKMSSLNSTQNNGMISDRKKHQRSSSSAVTSTKNIRKMIVKSFENFKNKHFSFVDKHCDRTAVVKKHDKYVSGIRKTMFSENFIKSLIFNAWKGLWAKRFNAESNLN